MFRVTWVTSTDAPKAKERGLWPLNHCRIVRSFRTLRLKTYTAMSHFYHTRHKVVNRSTGAMD